VLLRAIDETNAAAAQSHEKNAAAARSYETKGRVAQCSISILLVFLDECKSALRDRLEAYATVLLRAIDETNAAAAQSHERNADARDWMRRKRASPSVA
jgi:hypothetical protein